MTISSCLWANFQAWPLCGRRSQKSILAWAIAVGIQPFCEFDAWAATVHFNSAFLPEGSEYLDLSPFEAGNAIVPGEYIVDVLVNEQPLGRKIIRFMAQEGSDSTPCLSPALLDELGVVRQASSGVTDECIPLSQRVSGANVSFDVPSQQLRLSVPQAAMRRDARGYVNPELWNSGATAGTFAYSANATRTLKGQASDTAYMGYNSGLNLGQWRARYDGSLSWQASPNQLTHQDLNTYVQRDITTLKSQLTLGETYSNGDLFNSLNFRGVQLATDDRMQPQSLRGYAPMIRGIARTGARVVVRQANNIVLETLVAPGAFVIDDLYANGYAGDLAVTVYEADGSQQYFIVPYASVAQLLRPGVSRFSLTAGEVRKGAIDSSPSFMQGTFQHGLNNTFTLEGGVQASEKYWALLTGLAFNTPIGAMSLDLTQSRSQFQSGAEQGESLRLLYNKASPATGSYFNAASYWYSEKGAQNLNDALQRLAFDRRVLDGRAYQRVSNRYQIQAYQSMGAWGQLGASAEIQHYRNASGRDVQYQLNYAKQVGRVGVDLSAIRSAFGIDKMQNSYVLTLNLPFELGDRQSYSQLRASVGRDVAGHFNENLNLSGTAGENHQYGYGVGMQHDGAGGTTGSSAQGQYLGSRVSTAASYSQGAGYSSLGVSASGGVVAHSNGVTFTPYSIDTIAVVSAPGAQGAEVVGYPGVKLDGQGNAVVPYLRPYEFNDVGIDPIGAPMDVELASSIRKVAPRAGAVLAVDFATTTGRSVLIKVKSVDGKALPFGANVKNRAGNSLGMVGQGGQLYARVSDDDEQLFVSWGPSAEQQCTLSIGKQDKERHSPQLQDALCKPVQH
ncbi:MULTISPECIES: fimbria/pilus outer membrane usher protein [unclassified Pseudomonas]|uniref:fimbria/pilus outer membrane usher protein n=1 Tax=unclassified Pseudomonas TaxID=196821 RepID=UPI000C8695BE|nr:MULTISPECIES: fimbria/pilus outer membrane usher protein [unclassified Pseudomonas]PMV17974.1 fimbrial protein [Pseudomonas sp. FW305-3-2-15-C-TSA2]PMV19316.1 fimbrial protein [Pseudomonas sp. DP16D-L5]PMV33407.1 fimbrial protein [Pseudomonas sp. FW305-3-2-15-A-LB2]PMV38491.1 fimbrial protein [Pseudomonas sp. FW305-3-2-15-C-R2A1]PMV43557.1 fimbrial protein [Pseudomonas sp. FW305-3-2-15-C-LB1]